MATDEKTIDKLRKLIAHEQSARKIGNVAEAEAFAGRINEWLLKHKLSMSDIEVAEAEAKDPIDKQIVEPEELGLPGGARRWEWLEKLASTIARAHFCNIMVWEGSRRLTFVGRSEDREAAIYLYGYMAGLIMFLAEKEAKAYKKTEEYRDAVGNFLDERYDTTLEAAKAAVVRAFRRSYYKGFISAISKRFNDQRKAAEGAVAPDSTALVSLRNTEALVKEFITKASSGKASGFSGNAHNATGYAAGVRAGQTVGLTGKVLAEGRG